MSATERFYRASSGLYENTAEIKVEVEGQSDPLSGVTRIVCEMQPSGEIVDSDNSPNAITWQNSGDITLDFAEHSFDTVPAGMQRCKLLAYDPAHPNGQVLAHRDGEDNNLNILFID